MPPPSRSSFSRRFSVYLAGVAIGCVIMGLFALARQRAAPRPAPPVAPATSEVVGAGEPAGRPSPAGAETDE